MSNSCSLTAGRVWSKPFSSQMPAAQIRHLLCSDPSSAAKKSAGKAFADAAFCECYAALSIRGVSVVGGCLHCSIAFLHKPSHAEHIASGKGCKVHQLPQKTEKPERSLRQSAPRITNQLNTACLICPNHSHPGFPLLE